MPVVTVDAPTRGLNAFDSPEDMHPADAIALDNWICRAGYLESRPLFNQIFGAGVNSGYCKLAVYRGEASEKLLVFKDTGEVWVYPDDDPNTDLATDSGFTGFGENICTFHINNVLIILDGTENEQSFDGSTFTDLDYTGSDPAIPSGGAFTYGCNFKGRAIYINEDDCSFWYAEAGSYQGNITEFPLDSIARFGGTPKHVAVWTMDTGVGPDDTLVIYMTSGEVLLYQGDDPGDPDNWEIIGSFKLADPISKHASVTVGADLILLAENGYVNMTDVLRVDQQSNYPEYSRRIAPMLEELTDVFTGEDESFTNVNHAIAATSGLIIFNWSIGLIRGAGGAKFYQFVLNVATGAWSRWTGLSAFSWVEFDGALYYADGSFGWRSVQPGDDFDWEQTWFSAVPAFTNLGMPDAKKQITAVQIDSTFPEPEKIEVTGYSDFNFEGSLPTASAATGASPGSLTGLGTFPNVRLAMLQTTKRGWHNIHAYGFYVSLAVEMSMVDPRRIYWRSTSYRFRKAGAQ